MMGIAGRPSEETESTPAMEHRLKPVLTGTGVEAAYTGLGAPSKAHQELRGLHTSGTSL